MNSTSRIERALKRAEFQWKLLRFLRHSFFLGLVVCATLAFACAAVLAGWIESRAIFITCIVISTILAFVCLLLIIVHSAVTGPAKSRLAEAIERMDNRLLDRLNALLFLESRQIDATARGFSDRIERQAAHLIEQRAPPRPFSATATLVMAAAFVLGLAATGFLYERAAPFSRLATNNLAVPEHGIEPEPPLAIPPPETTQEEDPAWGEVRITEPGTDLKMTKVDVIPLQIEAASSHPLGSVNWATAVNGTDEVLRPLPSPTDPRSALYKPVLYLDELDLSDWDVLTYHATAKTQEGAGYGSEVYFVEIRPFREDILKLPGGEGGGAYQRLNEFTSLINRQQQVIRDTYAHQHRRPAEEQQAREEREKLAAAEADLATGARHLYASMASNLEHASIGTALESLARAETALQEASRRLTKGEIPVAQNRERAALAALVAARKSFHKGITDSPASGEGEGEPEQAPVVDAKDKLKQMAEFRNEEKVAQELIRNVLTQQRALERQARSSPASEHPELAERERLLQNSLENFEANHPTAFEGVEESSEAAGTAMAEAAGSLQQRSPRAVEATREATEKLQQLDRAFQNLSATRQLAQAHRLKELLDEHTATLAGQPGTPGNAQEFIDAAGASRQIVEELRNLAEQEPTRDLFKSPLRDALSGENKVRLDAALNRAQSAQEGSQAAGGAAEELSRVSTAFEQSLPESLQMAQQTDALKPDTAGSLNQGRAELESLLRQLERGQEPSPGDQQKQIRQALSNVQRGMSSQNGDNSAGNQILRRLEQLAQAEGLDPGDLRRLLQDLDRAAAEMLQDFEPDAADLANIDLRRLPPAYRDRIQTYYQKLSER